MGKIIRSKVTSPEADAITASVKNNFSESIIEVFDIETKNNDSTAVVIKVNKIFNGKEKSFNDVLSNISFGGSVKADLSYIESLKSFPKNVVIKSQLTTSVSEGGPALSVTLGVTSNIVLLDKVPMKPRFSDKRIGYFTEKHWYFADAQQAMVEKELITRWKLEPKKGDEERYLKGELVEPQNLLFIISILLRLNNGEITLLKGFVTGKLLLKKQDLRMLLLQKNQQKRI